MYLKKYLSLFEGAPSTLLSTPSPPVWWSLGRRRRRRCRIRRRTYCKKGRRKEESTVSCLLYPLCWSRPSLSPQARTASTSSSPFFATKEKKNKNQKRKILKKEEEEGKYVPFFQIPLPSTIVEFLIVNSSATWTHKRRRARTRWGRCWIKRRWQQVTFSSPPLSLIVVFQLVKINVHRCRQQIIWPFKTRQLWTGPSTTLGHNDND